MPRRALIAVAVLAFAALTMGANSCDTTGGGGGKGKNEQSAGGGGGGSGGGGGGGGSEILRGGGSGGGGAGSGGSTDGCDPNYEGACLDPNSADYDCEGGTGDGPDYVAGPIQSVGTDPYDLDADGDGSACTS